MDSNYPFAGMTLTDIFEIQSLQSLFIKFWYLGLTSEFIVAPQDFQIFKAIRKNITFANCFSFEMPLRTYTVFIEKILLALSSIDPKKTFDVLLGHLRNNKVSSVSFELFGVAFLQLFGRILELLNSQIMNKILRKIFLEITMLSKVGVAAIKLKNIKSISFEELIPNFQDLVEEKSLTPHRPVNPEHVQVNYDKNLLMEGDLKTLKGRMEVQKNYNLEMREVEGDHYPIGEKMRSKEKANISCFMMGGFEIVDYSDSINQLHKKLLTKILLNK